MGARARTWVDRSMRRLADEFVTDFPARSNRASVAAMIRRRRRLALLPLVLAFGCTEPSGTGGTVDGPGPATVEGAAPSEAAPPDDGSTLASGNPAAAEEPEPAVAEEPAEPKPPELVIPDKPYKVLILGDSLAATGFGVLLEDKLDKHPHVDAYRKAKSATGLARPDFFDWYDEGPKQVEFRKPDLVIVVMGGNDGQDIPPWKGSDRVRWDSDEWPAAYRGRVDRFLQEIAAPVAREDGSEVGARILWLGLPQMGLKSLEKKLVLIRQIQQDAVASHGQGAVYLDTTPFLVDAQGALIDKAPVDGKERELRAEDGIHFTMSGSEYLADKVYPGVLEVLALPDIDALPKPDEPKPASDKPAG
jgi:hypothetical protein